MKIKVSSGNSKLGAIPSISLPAGLTCRADCDCQQKCYAKKLERIRKTVREAYQTNLRTLVEEPEIFWREVEASLMLSRYFRFHVSGDIPNPEYLRRMIEAASKNPHCEILCFTKRYDLVNNYIASGGRIPKNLHLVFSAWRGLQMDNPHHFPEAHVRYKDGTTTASETAKECGGNCSECALVDCGCWSLKNGEQVVFNEH